MTFRRLACLFMTTVVPLAGASHDERLSRLERDVAKLQSLVRGISRQSTLEDGNRAEDRENSGGTYRIRSGDSYWSISRRLGISVKDLERANPETNASTLRIGAKLKLPGDEGEAGPKSSSPVINSQTGLGSYTVKRGDILGRISEAHGIRLYQLMAANPGLDAKRLKIGQVLTIPDQSPPTREKPRPVHDFPEKWADAISDLPGPPPQAGPPVPPSPASTKSGTTLVTVAENLRFAEIALQHRTSVATLNRLNEIDLSPEQMIKTGSQLYVPGR